MITSARFYEIMNENAIEIRKQHKKERELYVIQIKSTPLSTSLSLSLLCVSLSLFSFSLFSFSLSLFSLSFSLYLSFSLSLLSYKNTTSLPRASLVAQTVKNLPATQDTWVQSLGWEDPLEKRMVTPSSNLAWRIPWTEEPSSLQSTGSQGAGHA